MGHPATTLPLRRSVASHDSPLRDTAAGDTVPAGDPQGRMRETNRRAHRIFVGRSWTNRHIHRPSASISSGFALR